MERLEDIYHSSFEEDELLEATLEHERRERELQELYEEALELAGEEAN